MKTRIFFIDKQCVVKGLSVEFHEEVKVLEGFRHARVHVARMVIFDRESRNA